MASSLDTVVEHKIQATAEQWVEHEVCGVADALKHFASSHGDLLNEVCSAVDKYVSDEVKKDVPTGTGTSRLPSV